MSGGGVSGGGMGGTGQQTPPRSSAVDFAAKNACHQAHALAVTAPAVRNQSFISPHVYQLVELLLERLRQLPPVVGLLKSRELIVLSSTQT